MTSEKTPQLDIFKAHEVVQVDLSREMATSYTRYAMSVIVGRALPDARDGMKPVHRRILHSMREQGMLPDRQHKKSAAAVGEVIGKYHPHGLEAVYDALVRMAQSFSLRYPLIDGHGNFGSVDGDPPAAMRYTEARLAPLAMEMLRDIDQNTVDFQPNYSEEHEEPTVLPAVFPNMLANGATGIAVGMATNIPPHNLRELCDAVTLLLNKPEATVKDLLRIMPGPDFPTSGLILGRKGIEDYFSTGRGTVTMQARAAIEPMEREKSAILITEIPYQVNKESLVKQIAALAREKRIEGISELNDYSDKSGMRIVIELKRDANPNVVLNFLYKHTQLRQNFGVIMLALVDGQPKVMPIKEALVHFIEHRKIVIRRRTQFQLKQAEARAHILDGFRIILKFLDEAIQIIRRADNAEHARTQLMSRFELSTEQANAVLNMMLRQLTRLSRDEIEREYQELMEKIKDLKDILARPERITVLIGEDMKRIKKEFGDERRTQIIAQEAADISIEDLIAEEDMVITVTRDGYIKRLPVDTYRVQGRGGRGVIGLTKKEEDIVEHLFVCTTHHTILFFTNRGRAYHLKAYEVPAASRQARGTPIINLLQVERGERATACVSVENFKARGCLFMATKLGVVKKTDLAEFDTNRKGGLIAITLEGADELNWVKFTDGQREVMMVTRGGKSIRFGEGDVRSMGRPAAGVRGIRLRRGDVVVSMDLVTQGHDLLVAGENGFGKRTDVDEYRDQSRGGSGIITMKVTEKTGAVLDAVMVHPDDELMIISRNGVVIRSRVAQIRKVGRNSQGVLLIRLEAGDRVGAIARIVSEEEAS